MTEEWILAHRSTHICLLMLYIVWIIMIILYKCTQKLSLKNKNSVNENLYI